MQVIDTSKLDSTKQGWVYEGRELNANEVYWIYNGLDCCLTSEIRGKLIPQLDDTTRATYQHTMNMQAPILEMNCRGILTDREHMKRLIVEYEKIVAHLESILHRFCVEGIGMDAPFNPNSPTQVKHFFYTVLGIKPIRKKNTSGKMADSSDRETLEKLRKYFHAEPFVNLILEIRDHKKKIGFLKTPMPNNRLYTNFNLAGTNTGRLASRSNSFGVGTNLQNVDKNMKYMLVPDEGKVLVNVDLEQADSRNVGALAWNMFYDADRKTIAKAMGLEEWHGPIGPEFAGSYLDACESGDLHTTVCRMAWGDLDWPDDREGWRDIADQIAYRDLSYRDMSKKLGHGCLTADHEVLTPQGWVSISEQPDAIMEWDEQGSRFTQATHWEAKPYSGELQLFEGNSMSALMTHDHRVPYKADQRSKGIKERPASAGPQCAMPLGSGWEGGNEVVPAKLYAAFMCDGSQNGNFIVWHFRKQRKFIRLFDLLKEAGIPFRLVGNRVTIRATWPKHPGAFMFNWTRECLLDFVLELRHWDGHVSDTAVSISCSTKEDLEWYQTFGRLLGIGGAIQKPRTSGYGTTMYRLQQNNRQYANGVSVTHTRHEVNNVMVYCPTVSSGWFYVRRDGKIFVTGNTNYLGQPKTMAMHTKVAVEIISEFQRRYSKKDGAFPVITAWQNETIRLLQTQGYLTHLFGRRRCFFGRLTDQSVINAAIAYCPQGMTGDAINIGILNLWHDKDFELLIQVHDSILFQVDQARVNELVPRALELLEAPLTLKGGRRFVIPLDAQVGWNAGERKVDKKTGAVTNPTGLVQWTGEERRSPPTRKRNLVSARSLFT